MHVVLNFRYLLLVLVLGLYPGAFTADFKIGPDTTLDSLAIVTGQNNYLVAWRDLSAGASKPQMTGVFVGATGIATAAFPISDAAGLPQASPVQRSLIAFDATNFLMVWADNRASGPGIRGALISQQGTVVGGADFLIAPLTAMGSNNPQVVFAGTTYLVAWQDAPAGSASGAQIFYSRVSAAGAPGAKVALPLVSGSSGAQQSLEFLTAGQGNEALIVFQDLDASPVGSFGARVAVDNTLANGETRLFKRDILSQGFGAPIAAAFDGTQYVILSSFGAQLDSTVFSTRFKLDGSVLNPSVGLAEVAQGATGLPEDNFPRAIFNGSNEYLFPRNIKASNTSYHIFYDRVQIDGTNRDLNPRPIDTASQGILNGAVAAPLGSQYLLVWMDGRRLSGQPAGQANIFGLLIDDTLQGDTTRPFLNAVARAAPLNGPSPLKVQFVGATSSGIPDTIQWDFGDGSTDPNVDPLHTYGADGDYIAVLSLFKTGYAVHDFVHVAVGGLLLGGAGGPPQATAGAPGPISASVNPNLLLNQVAITLNFTKPDTDALFLSGFLDPSIIPVSVNGTTATITVGSKTYSAGFDSAGRAVGPAGAHFFINSFSGAFSLTTSADTLQATLAPFGAVNEADPAPGKDVVVPVSVSYANTTYQANVTGKYTAQSGKSGKFVYFFSKTGSTDNGYIQIFQSSATESAKTPNRVHAFTLIGNFGPGGAAQLTKADAGSWRFTLGNYVEDIPVGSLTENATTYQFKGAKGKIGINQFIYDRVNGRFGLSYKGVLAEGDTASGMPVATSTVNRVDMAFSVDLATTGANFQASDYARLVRTKPGKGKWKQR